MRLDEIKQRMERSNPLANYLSSADDAFTLSETRSAIGLIKESRIDMEWLVERVEQAEEILRGYDRTLGNGRGWGEYLDKGREWMEELSK